MHCHDYRKVTVSGFLNMKGNIMQVHLYYAFSNHACHYIIKPSVKQKRLDNNDIIMMMMMVTMMMMMKQAKNCRLSYLLNKYPSI